MINNIVLDWHGVLDTVSPMTLRYKFLRLFIKLILKAKFSQAWHILLFSFDSYSHIITDYSAGRMHPDDFWRHVESQTDPKTAKEFKSALMQVKLNHDLISKLQQIQSNYKLYILSDCPEDKKNIINKLLPKPLHFEQIFYSCDYKTTKREKHLFEILIQSESISPAQTLFVDDSPKNIKIAKQFGLQTLLYKTQASADQLTKKLR